MPKSEGNEDIIKQHNPRQNWEHRYKIRIPTRYMYTCMLSELISMLHELPSMYAVHGIWSNFEIHTSQILMIISSKFLYNISTYVMHQKNILKIENFLLAIFDES